MTEQPTTPDKLAEAEVIARHAGTLNWWAELVMNEYDQMRTDLAVLRTRNAELEEHERERIANAQHQYTEAWNAYQRLLKRIGAAAGVELPPDLRYNKYEKQILAKITDLRAGQPNT